ncbi:MAG: CRISPR-associated endonuclease Cas3'' [Planctomycetia bacterium]|nr:CRISPR-associated endonuclease Cas3'' [Planctomycetia bacterium]
MNIPSNTAAVADEAVDGHPAVPVGGVQLLAHPYQSLADHLSGVARRAQHFAEFFDAGRQAFLAGVLHDLGKADGEFQKRMEAIRRGGKDPGGKKAHAPHGASLLLDPPEGRGGPVWPAAFAIFGHHAGLHNRSDLQKCLSQRQAALEIEPQLLPGDPGWNGVSWPVQSFGQNLPGWLERLPFATLEERAAKFRAVDFYTRFLFSALVDADRLDTEQHDPKTKENFATRRNWRFGETGLAGCDATTQLLVQLDTAIDQRSRAAGAKKASAAVLDVRAKVLAACKSAARGPRGVFTLTVPTGGGKTLASTAFALSHIVNHNEHLPKDDPHRLRRIIVVIPYLNIIQQTTLELRKVFGDLVWRKGEGGPLTGQKSIDPETGEEGVWVSNDDPGHLPLVLEHHSQAQEPPLNEAKVEQGKESDYGRERTLRQLAAENWDAPVIVTTSVQFFNSLFSRRPADARKLHNICQSVVIFDEVQTLPPLLLQPILDALKELTNPERPYGCSLVLCTATQPALERNPDLEFGFEGFVPIVAPEDAKDYFRRLKRVEYHGLAPEAAPQTLTSAELVKAMLGAPRQQAMTILNTRKQARELFDRLAAGAPETLRGAVFHLSTWMYPAHRLQVLAEVSMRLNRGMPCLLVSTQCVEAGVDVDFPAVWRAFGPYDSIVQAAGRCNRSGSFTDAAGNPILGQVHIFTPEYSAQPGGVYESAMQTAALLCRMGKADPHEPESFDRYFRLLYQVSVPDRGGCAVQSAREKLHFKVVSDLFNFIDSDSVPLLIGSAIMAGGETVEHWCDEHKNKWFFTPDEWRLIQPFIVNLAYPLSFKTKAFFNDTDSPLVFKGDDADRGLRLLKTTEPKIYHDGPTGSGLDLECKGLSDLANYVR